VPGVSRENGVRLFGVEDEAGAVQLDARRRQTCVREQRDRGRCRRTGVDREVAVEARNDSLPDRPPLFVHVHPHRPLGRMLSQASTASRHSSVPVSCRMGSGGCTSCCCRQKGVEPYPERQLAFTLAHGLTSMP
jgi:hypothetical protein